MLHSIKRKTVGVAAGRHEPVNAEFDTLRSNLDNVQKSLTSAIQDVDDAEKHWTSLITGTESFSTDLHSLYPKDDEVRVLFKSTLDKLQGTLQKDLKDVTEPQSKIRGIERMVRAYLTELKTLAQEYHKVNDSRKDFAMAKTKVDKVTKKNKGDETQTKHLDKLEANRATYDSILEGTIHRMQTTYDKAPSMFKATYVAYWLYQSMAMEVLQKHVAAPTQYAKIHADSLFHMSESSKAGQPSSPSKSK